MKHDGLGGTGTMKDRWDLLPMRELQDVIKVVTYGAKKYAANNWVDVEEARERYYAAAQRHIVAWWLGESVDSDTGLPHLAHAVCDLLFLLGFSAGDAADIRQRRKK